MVSLQSDQQTLIYSPKARADAIRSDNRAILI